MLQALMFAALLAAGGVDSAPPASRPASPPEGGPRATQVVVRGPKGEELICKREVPVGSRMPVRTCMTAYDWAEKNAASLRALDQMTGRGTYP